MCGDFNLVQDQNLDTYNYVNINNPKAKDCILTIKDDFNLTDPFRDLYKQKIRYTWRKSNPVKQARLDFFLVSDSLMPSIDKVDILPSYRSDHSTVVLSLHINEFQKGTGLWKFNNSLLKDIEYAKTVKECINRVKEQYMVPVYDIDFLQNDTFDELQFTISDQLFLELLLLEIRGKTISYAAYKKKQSLLREQTLIQEINNLEEDDTLDTNILEEKKTELQNIRKEKMQGILVRAKLRWAEEGEKPTKYFCNLESRNYTNKTIFKVIKDNGDIITKQKKY